MSTGEGIDIEVLVQIQKKLLVEIQKLFWYMLIQNSVNPTSKKQKQIEMKVKIPFQE